ncbi:unnamed protein product [Clonostachys byssicola]|uniref:3,2-trans-enoyl-CoA isomerase n=1 Tax=Clonostachys byssicola TaxID=160290 RepID=A0A9N9ULJ6_9HYPO|nr:unnamed protein product [Clonostachys byssicola]
MDYGTESVIELEYKGRFAILTINKPEKLNALSRAQYYELAQKLREIADRSDVYVTVLLAKGRFFSAGADVGMPRATPAKDNKNLHREYLQTFVAFNLNIAHAFYTHPKILVVGLNGPVVGMSAAFVAHADFIYCTPHTYLLTPFSSIGLVAEGGASRALVQRLGVSKANEAMIMSKRISSKDLEQCGFVNGIIDTGREQDELFREKVLEEVTERLGDHLIGDSLVEIKRLIRKPEMSILQQQNVEEVFAGLERFMTGVPQEQFNKLARGEKRHKL